MTMKIIWDSKKAAANPKNHDGVTFEEAQHVLFDPFALTREDSDSENEQRFITLGMGGEQRSCGRLHIQGRNNTAGLSLEGQRAATEAI